MDDFFAPGEPVRWSSAPGRLDVMGGIADYSGATVLPLPLACRTTVMLQAQKAARCDVVTVRRGRRNEISLRLADLTAGVLREPAALAQWFAGRGDDRWASYVIGVVQWCLKLAAESSRIPAPSGMRLLIASAVPEAMGVASSAALEVAAMSVVASSRGIVMAPEVLASACQWVENHVVGAPCGIMDQMTSVCGRADHLLRLRCQPAIVEGFVPVPAGYRFYGITSGARHAVTGADYGTVRTAAFMGLRVLQGKGERGKGKEPWGGYLANIAPDEFDHLETALPERMTGAEFLERYGGISDTVTRVEPGRSYPVRQATAHPVREQQRILKFASLLGSFSGGAEASELGRLMAESHRSYSASGLGSDATDQLVALAAESGPDAGVFGARITGGGSGGTVAVLATVEAEPRVREIARRYSEATGRAAQVLAESGPGWYPDGFGTFGAHEAHDLARRIAEP